MLVQSAILFLIATSVIGFARVIRVPGDAASIQAALDSLIHGDTISVSRGTYSETLIAPAISFHLIGDFDDSGGENARPFLRSDGIGQLDSTASLWLPRSCSIVIENFRISNQDRIGIRSRADTVILRNCVIEDTEYGLREMQDSISSHVQIEDCNFGSNQYACMFMGLGNQLVARRCVFEGVDEILPLVNAQDIDIDSCTFRSNPGRVMILGYYGTVTITNCRFDSTVVSSSGGISVVQVVSALDVRIENNAFRACQYRSHVLDLFSEMGGSLNVRGNQFEHCVPNGAPLTAEGVVAINAVVSEGGGLTIENNTFRNCSGSRTADDILGPILVASFLGDNQFLQDVMNGLPSIYAGNPSWQPTPLTLINNRWENCGYAVDLSAAADARENYWGHDSGPYHAEFNLEGQGDTITGNVPFIPWLIDSTDAVDDPVIVPYDYALAAYPNPFNATTTLQFTLTQRTRVALKVFDLLGREVTTLVNEVREAGTHAVAFDRAALASNIYFARLETPQASRVTRLLLLK